MKKCNFLLLFLLIPILISAQQQTYSTNRISDEAPVIDGIMDDKSWNLVEWGGDFIQQEPYEGKSPSQPTYFKILYDDVKTEKSELKQTVYQNTFESFKENQEKLINV